MNLEQSLARGLWKVLHVADSRIAQVAVARAVQLVAPGSDVTAVPSEAAAAEALAQGGGWQLAVIDLMLEAGQGFNVLRQFRQAHPKALLVVLSDFAAPGVVQRCRAAGADAVFRKEEFHAFAQFLQEQAPGRGRSPVLAGELLADVLQSELIQPQSTPALA